MRIKSKRNLGKSLVRLPCIFPYCSSYSSVCVYPEVLLESYRGWRFAVDWSLVVRNALHPRLVWQKTTPLNRQKDLDSLFSSQPEGVVCVKGKFEEFAIVSARQRSWCVFDRRKRSHLASAEMVRAEFVKFDQTPYNGSFGGREIKHASTKALANGFDPHSRASPSTRPDTTKYHHPRSDRS